MLASQASGPVVWDEILFNTAKMASKLISTDMLFFKYTDKGTRGKQHNSKSPQFFWNQSGAAALKRKKTTNRLTPEESAQIQQKLKIYSVGLFSVIFVFFLSGR